MYQIKTRRRNSVDHELNPHRVKIQIWYQIQNYVHCAVQIINFDKIWFEYTHWRKKLEYVRTVHQLFIYFKEAYDSVRREVLYNILVEFSITTKLRGLFKYKPDFL
jgi:hypothetical protein